MKKALIIVLLSMVATTLGAQDIKTLIADINKITEQKTGTVLGKLELEKLKGFVQSAEEQGLKTLQPEDKRALSIAKVVIHNNWLKDYSPGTIREDALSYLRNNADGDFVVDEKMDKTNELVEEAKTIVTNKESFSAEDVTFMQKLFTYYVDVLENTDPLLRVIPSTFETNVMGTMFIQEKLAELLTSDHLAASLDIDALLTYSQKLYTVTDAARVCSGDGLEKMYTGAKRSYLESIGQNMEKIVEFRIVK